MPPPRGSRPAGCHAVSMLGLLVVASLCCGCFFVGARWENVVLRSDSGRMERAVVYAGDLEGDHGGGRRRLLAGGPGPGSHPPRCTSKCGSCSPCVPVHVSVPPGVMVTTEYYPVAWRCKCRDRLYMP
ncbi:uncharacterized protein LOC123414068 [Hordeum vulgare subsp. vulgare]|uniref:Epidermal patterning factor-like protein n=2 Tax=Hordeum vulgare subsp. vulgare TaxID=112509 RepID=A0A8I6WHN3_HORVV|nr:uncharacterized protein LOC123414068 [Hordeum vulgare subsp. vulgare]KAI5018990.1 hypothetical protein ZWY2020_043878 [Hordeum vulgare]